MKFSAELLRRRMPLALRIERIKVVRIAVFFYWHVACSFNFADAFSAFSSYLRYLLLLVLVEELTM